MMLFQQQIICARIGSIFRRNLVDSKSRSAIKLGRFVDRKYSSERKKVTVPSLVSKMRDGRKISM